MKLMFNEEDVFREAINSGELMNRGMIFEHWINRWYKKPRYTWSHSMLIFQSLISEMASQESKLLSMNWLLKCTKK